MKILHGNPTRESNSRIQLENPTRNPNSTASMSPQNYLCKRTNELKDKRTKHKRTVKVNAIHMTNKTSTADQYLKKL